MGNVLHYETRIKQSQQLSFSVICSGRTTGFYHLSGRPKGKLENIIEIYEKKECGLGSTDVG